METKIKWCGYIESIEETFNEANIVYKFQNDDTVFSIDLDKIPEDCRVLGQYCRIVGDTMEWCRDVWTQEEIDAAREKGKELDELFKEKEDK